MHVRSLAGRIAVEAWGCTRRYISFVQMNLWLPRAVSAIRSVTAAVVTFGVLLGPFESLLPDVHDDRGSVASEQTLSDPGSTASADVPAARYVPSPGNSTDRTGGHSFRVDHCNHSHYLSLGTRVAVTISGNRALPVETSSLELLSVSLSPHSRPPIA